MGGVADVKNLFDEPYHEQKRNRSNTHVRQQGIGNLAVEGLESGMTLDEVARELGVKKGVLFTTLAKMKYECEEVDREYAFRRGLFGSLFRATDKQAAEICGASVTSMVNWRTKHDIPANREEPER